MWKMEGGPVVPVVKRPGRVETVMMFFSGKGDFWISRG